MDKVCFKVHKKFAKDKFIPYHLIEFIKNNESQVIQIDSFVWENDGEKILQYIEQNWDTIKLTRLLLL